MRAAAIQIEAVVGDIDANLELCARHATAAAHAGATWIALPEFFSTGVGNLPELAENAPAADGEPTRLLQQLAARHGAHVGGSTLVRDADGHVRNAFLLAGPDGRIVGRHDKDLPTMWENALYVGGTDPGRISTGDLEVGVALCWEYMRTQTASRLAGRVDLVIGGSGWWSIPAWPPRAVFGRLEAANRRRAVLAPSTFATYVGAPVVHAAHSGPIVCPLPWTPVTYRGRFEGGASVTDGDGTVLARRDRSEGSGFVVADIEAGRRPYGPAGDRFWLQRRGALASVMWSYQRVHGRRAYRRALARRAERG